MQQKFAATLKLILFPRFVQIAGDLLDLVGDSAFETVQNLLLVRISYPPLLFLKKSY